MPLRSPVLFTVGAIVLAGFLSSFLSGCKSTTTERLQLDEPATVQQVDLSRYVGTWYEIASYPQRFQKGCTGTTATYTLKDNGEIKVVNRCRLGTLDGEPKMAEGRARVVDTATNAKLQVSFFGPFWGDYWVFELDDGYRYAAVGAPSRDYLWVLSRTPQMPAADYDALLKKLESKGFPLDRLQKTAQPEKAPAAPPDQAPAAQP
jgi:apolipoprotein D and lipocalin family protein